MCARKNSQKRDLLEMPTIEKVQLVREIKEKLRQKVVEAKLWQSLLEAENITINGKTLFHNQDPLTGFCLKSEPYYK